MAKRFTLLLVSICAAVAISTAAPPPTGITEDPYEAGLDACIAAVKVDDCVAEAKQTNDPKQLARWGDKLTECCVGKQVKHCMERKIMSTPICTNYSQYFIGMLEAQMNSKFQQWGCDFNLCH